MMLRTQTRFAQKVLEAAKIANERGKKSSRSSGTATTVLRTACDYSSWSARWCSVEDGFQSVSKGEAATRRGNFPRLLPGGWPQRGFESHHPDHSSHPPSIAQPARESCVLGWGPA